MRNPTAMKGSRFDRAQPATAKFGYLLIRSLSLPVLTREHARRPGVPSRTYCLLTHCPIFSVPNVPMPFRRKAKTKRFSLRTPTLKLKAWAVTMQHFQV